MIKKKRSGARAAVSAARVHAPVTLEQVAARAGVSPSTVSRILNGTASVSAAKQAAVDAAIKDLGFSPNPVSAVWQAVAR
jgi:LacI family transcriptional regulator